MTNREKYVEQLMKISFSGNRVAIVNGAPVNCGALSNCSSCELFADDGCRKRYSEWANAEADETPAVETEEISAHDNQMHGKTISIAAVKDAYIQTANDVISGVGSTGDEKLDMATLYGIWSMYTNTIAIAESEAG